MLTAHEVQTRSSSCINFRKNNIKHLDRRIYDDIDLLLGDIIRRGQNNMVPFHTIHRPVSSIQRHPILRFQPGLLDQERHALVRTEWFFGLFVFHEFDLQIQGTLVFIRSDPQIH